VGPRNWQWRHVSHFWIVKAAILFSRQGWVFCLFRCWVLTPQACMTYTVCYVVCITCRLLMYPVHLQHHRISMFVVWLFMFKVHEVLVWFRRHFKDFYFLRITFTSWTIFHVSQPSFSCRSFLPHQDRCSAIYLCFYIVKTSWTK
jgi:hypothetical protein